MPSITLSASPPKGVTNSIQYNAGGVFAGSSNLTWDGSTLSVSGELSLYNGTTSSSGVLNEAGIWKLQIYLAADNNAKKSDIGSFMVHENLE